ncbi:MAG: hypothetical protein LBF58_10150 [Deltaproteobacteria bacterium]|jgi:hypothetical protein|nr:hypothetical protein [Deltaproteobacteria bacterium]
MKKINFLILFAFLACLIPSTVWADNPAPQYEKSTTGIGYVGGLGTTIYNFTAAPRAPEIMAKHFGSSDISDLVTSKGYPSRRGDNNKWFNYDQDLKKYYGDDRSVRSYSQAQKDLYLALLNQENKLRNVVSQAKGNAGESMMHNWYGNNGWERLNSKTGPHGFDGLYVKRNANGQIIDFMVAESKTGFSSLGQTNAGRQMSRNWSRQKIHALRGNITQELQMARQNGDRTTVSRCLSELKDLDRIDKLHQQGRGRETLHKITLENNSGRPVLRMEFYKLKYVSDTEVVPQQRLTKKGNPSYLEVPLDADPSKLTKTQKTAINGYYDGLQQELVKQGIPEKTAQTTINKLKTDFQKGKIKGPLNGQSYESKIFDNILDNLRKNAGKDPQVAAAMKRLEREGLPGVPHAFSYRRAAAVGALTSGVLAMGFEFWQTGRISWASGREALTGGAIAGATAISERYMAIGINRVLSSVSGGMASKINFARFTKIGGAVPAAAVMIGISGVRLMQGKITASEFAVESATSVAILASSMALAKIGGAVGSFVMPGIGTAVGSAVGVVAGFVILPAYQYVKGQINEQRNAKLQLIEADIRDRQAREKSQQKIEDLIFSAKANKQLSKQELDKVLAVLR